MNNEMIVNNEFKDLLPKLSKEEFNQLEENIINNGCYAPILTWANTIIDGHNRYQICTKHNITFEVIELEFDNKDQVLCWMIDTQLGRRNVNDFIKYEFIQKKADILKEIGKEKSLRNLKQNNVTEVSEYNISEKQLKTQQKIAKDLKWSTGKVAQADIVSKRATEEQKDKLRKGEESISSVYNKVKKEREVKVNIEAEIPKVDIIVEVPKVDIVSSKVCVDKYHHSMIY